MRRVTAFSDGERYAVELMTEKHQWRSDEPQDLGGGDQGPSPYELMLSGVGACTAITARMYAQRKGWPLRSVRVELTHSKIRAEDCPGCKTEKGPVSVISMQISLAGDLDEAQKKRIFEIAGKCPVKRTLEGEVKISSELLEENSS